MKLLTELLKSYLQISDDIIINDIQIDSRKVTKNSLFIAINNGNTYIKEALETGVALVIYDRTNPMMEDDLIYKDSRVIRVEDSIKFLQDIAKLYRDNLNIKVVAITGSEGKTTTKDMIHAVLSKRFRTKKTMGNYNNHIGLPLTILSLAEDDEIVVLEMGMSAIGEIDALSKISRPDYAIITNIGDSHLEFLIDRDNVFKAKTEVLKYVDRTHTLLYGDDSYFTDVPALKVGFGKQNDYLIANIDESRDGFSFTVNDEEYFLPLNGVHNIINASFAVAMGKMFGLDYLEIRDALREAKITGMRFEKIIKDNILYINDAYNASPVSMKMALESFSKLPQNGKKIAVLGDILELGPNEVQYHREVLLDALKYDFDRVFLYGDRMKKAMDELKQEFSISCLDVKSRVCVSENDKIERIEHFNEKHEIKTNISRISDAVVLLKGSRGMRLEEIIKD